jgi:hypothetical protein
MNIKSAIVIAPDGEEFHYNHPQQIDEAISRFWVCYDSARTVQPDFLPDIILNLSDHNRLALHGHEVCKCGKCGFFMKRDSALESSDESDRGCRKGWRCLRCRDIIHETDTRSFLNRRAARLQARKAEMPDL